MPAPEINELVSSSKRRRNWKHTEPPYAAKTKNSTTIKKKNPNSPPVASPDNQEMLKMMKESISCWTTMFQEIGQENKKKKAKKSAKKSAKKAKKKNPESPPAASLNNVKSPPAASMNNPQDIFCSGSNNHFKSPAISRGLNVPQGFPAAVFEMSDSRGQQAMTAFDVSLLLNLFRDGGNEKF